MNAPTEVDIARLERKVDKLSEAMAQLVRVEERQLTQGIRLGECEKSVTAVEVKLDLLESKVDMWVNRGIGVWAMLATAWMVISELNNYGIFHLGGK